MIEPLRIRIRRALLALWCGLVGHNTTTRTHATFDLVIVHTACGRCSEWLGSSWTDRECRVCGCTYLDACAGGCSWIDLYLCSACEPAEAGAA